MQHVSVPLSENSSRIRERASFRDAVSLPTNRVADAMRASVRSADEIETVGKAAGKLERKRWGTFASSPTTTRLEGEFGVAMTTA